MDYISIKKIDLILIFKILMTKKDDNNWWANPSENLSRIQWSNSKVCYVKF